MISSPGCWKQYGFVLAREYNDPDLFKSAHRLTVDAYALQHPGDPQDKRAIQSIYLHYAALYLIFEMNRPHDYATKAMQNFAGMDFKSRPMEPKSFPYTLADFDSSSEAAHIKSAEHWAQTSFEAWNELKPMAIKLIQEF